MNRENKIVKIDPESPDPDLLKKTAEIIARGGVVVFPTSGLYGLAANSFDPKAVERIYRIKKRPGTMPILVLIPNGDGLGKVVSEMNPKARLLAEKFWPGKLTILFPARRGLPENLTGGTGKIGVRLPAHPVALGLARAFDNPITGTSANVSGHPGCADIRKMPADILGKVDSVLDAGPLGGGVGSTVVDVTGSKPCVLREGGISAARIFEVLKAN